VNGARWPGPFTVYRLPFTLFSAHKEVVVHPRDRAGAEQGHDDLAHGFDFLD
jgi:hypothetical protein